MTIQPHRPRAAQAEGSAVLLALECASHDYIELTERVRDLEGQVDTYQELLTVALSVCHGVIVQRRGLARRVRALLDEPRQLRSEERSAAA